MPEAAANEAPPRFGVEVVAGVGTFTASAGPGGAIVCLYEG